MSQLSQEAFIDRAGEIYEAGYAPNGEVLAALTDVSLLSVSGAAGAGKDTLRERLANPTRDLVVPSLVIPKVVSDTIREPQFRNGRWEEHGVDYIFRGDELDEALFDLEDGRYVQYGMGPNMKGFYGSRAESYPKQGAAMIDFTADQIDKVRKLPFESVHALYLVAHFDTWQSRFNGRGELEEDDKIARHMEAETSLETALADDQVVFVVNDELDRTVEDVTLVIEHKYSLERQETAREIGRQMLAGIRELNLVDS